MTPDELVTFVTTDIAAITRGRAVAASDLPGVPHVFYIGNASTL